MSGATFRRFVPPGARAVVSARDEGFRVGSVLVSAGWPSDWLKRMVAPPTLVNAPDDKPGVFDDNFAVGCVKSAAEYLWGWVIGLDVILWAESAQQANRLESEVFPVILAEHPERVTLFYAYDARSDVLKKSELALNV